MTAKEVKDFVAIKFNEYFKYIREEQSLSKTAKSLYIFLTAADEVEKYVQLNSSDNCIHHNNVKILNLYDPELQLINTKPMIKNKLKELEYKKINDCKIFYSCTKLIASDSDTDEAFQSFHQSIMTKTKNYAFKDWIVLDVIIKKSIKILTVSIRRKNGDNK